MTQVLFVCTGNTCRSPMAEALLNQQKLPGVAVKSAGIYATNGQSASRYAIEVLNDHNIYHQHSSSILTEQDVEWATYILTMTNSHKAIIEDLYPQHKEKVFTLKEYVQGNEGHDVLDPFGGTKRHYEETFAELANLVMLLSKKMKG
ncbi:MULTISPECIES: low molecular weight protein arginine phosphatase [Bacillus]|uniref:low molecular weight protein arginine phosphatase n=1 Tax=Bacillus TaxID=1386 RepID=UPI000307981F|nr:MULTISPECIES: low molecular weight protein arginine phosphatase [Bacillus]